MNKTYIELGDGFQFILPISFEKMNITLKYMAKAIYDLTTNEWKKYGITVYDSDYVQYQFRNVQDRRQNFDDVAILLYDDLVTAGYLIKREGCSAYVMNKREYSKRIQAFVASIKELPTTINLGVDEEMKALAEDYEEREQEREQEEANAAAWTPPRMSGRTYIQLGDGFEFVIERSVELVNQIMKLSSTAIYDLIENKWCKYRSTIYKGEDGRLHSKFYPNEEDRKKTFELAPVLTYDDLVKAGYMLDYGEGQMARYRFDFPVYKRRRNAANVIFDDAVSEERETGLPKD